MVGRRPGEVPNFTSPRHEGAYVSGDLGPDGAAVALLEAHQPRLVLNAAALSRVGDCEQDPALARRLNVEVPAEVAAWCAASGARLVHVSTDLVFGAEPPPIGGFTEDSAVGPVSVYGETKAAGERAVLDACPAALVVRLALLYGNSGGRGLGASDSLLEAVNRDAQPPLFVDEFRTPLEVSAAAEALTELLVADDAGLLHLAGPDRVSRHDLGLAVLRAMGLTAEEAVEQVRAARQAEVPTVGARPEDVSLDARRAARRLETDLPGIPLGTRRAVT
jgi:dTDP-4-dehydrorhamnose reductase